MVIITLSIKQFKQNNSYSVNLNDFILEGEGLGGIGVDGKKLMFPKTVLNFQLWKLPTVFSGNALKRNLPFDLRLLIASVLLF